jgi:hypothetical protein
MSSGRNADTVKFGTSNSWLSLRSAAALAIMYASLCETKVTDTKCLYAIRGIMLRKSHYVKRGL